MKATIINGQYYAEAGAFVTTDNSRYTLRAIRIEPHPEGGAVIVATDGHTLCVFHDANGICSEPVLVEFRKEVVPHLKLKKKRKGTPGMVRCIRINGDMEIINAARDIGAGYVLEDTIATFTNMVVTKGEFPNWRMVMPKTIPPVRSDYNADYIRKCALDKQTRCVAMWHDESNNKQAIIRSSQRDDFVAVIMPMHGGSEQAYPPYVKALLPKEPAAATKVRAKKSKTAARDAGTQQDSVEE